MCNTMRATSTCNAVTVHVHVTFETCGLKLSRWDVTRPCSTLTWNLNLLHHSATRRHGTCDVLQWENTTQSCHVSVRLTCDMNHILIGGWYMRSCTTSTHTSCICVGVCVNIHVTRSHTCKLTNTPLTQTDS